MTSARSAAISCGGAARYAVVPPSRAPLAGAPQHDDGVARHDHRAREAHVQLRRQIEVGASAR
ncbi:MAG: hypothetical protein HY744_32675 [Deltaproteobacteria bacterium]|nr:hypothetical protein [Deltaproteobacteria bacterium]